MKLKPYPIAVNAHIEVKQALDSLLQTAEVCSGTQMATDKRPVRARS